MPFEVTWSLVFFITQNTCQRIHHELWVLYHYGMKMVTGTCLIVEWLNMEKIRLVELTNLICCCQGNLELPDSDKVRD